MNRRLTKKFFILIFFGLLFFGRPAGAQDAGTLKLSITPPLFKINMNPGETWSSSVKLINNNTYPVTIYAEVLDFKSGATGGVEFIKDSAGGADKNSLSGWVDLNREPVTIPPQQSAELPFFIKLPPAADPGGHYAAILAGSKPPTDKTEGSAIKISSMLASLLLVRVGGEVVERGEIREFSVDRGLSWDLSAKLRVGFANTGNTHLQPQGEVKITNIWGEQRAILPINQKSSFGNVLPASEKLWEFDWRGSSSVLDAGRMRADVVIGFGEEATQTDARTIYFWTFSLKPTAIVLGIIIFSLLLIILLIRRYINKSLQQVRVQAEQLMQKEKALTATGRSLPGSGRSVINLSRSSEPESEQPEAEPLSWSMFKRVTVFLIIIIIAALLAVAFYYFGGFNQPEAGPETAAIENAAPTMTEITTPEPNIASTTASGTVSIIESAPSEPVATTSTSTDRVKEEVATTTVEQKKIKVRVENGGGVPGAAAKAAELIRSARVEITALGNADNFDHQTTEIRYQTGFKLEAEAIKLLLGGTASTLEDEQINEELVVIIGKDFK